MRRTKNNKGFSLVELIIVIAIMAILAGALAPALISYLKKAKYRRYLNDCKELERGIERLAVQMASEDNLLLAEIKLKADGDVESFLVYKDESGYACNNIKTSQAQYVADKWETLKNEVGFKNSKFSKPTQIFVDRNGKVCKNSNKKIGGQGEYTRIGIRDGKKGNTPKQQVEYDDSKGWYIEGYNE